MLKFWPSTPVDLTPRAGPNGQERQNPFDASISAQSAYKSDNDERRPPHNLSTGPLTPTTPSYHHQLLNTSHRPLSPPISAPTSSVSNGPDPAPQSPVSGPLTPSATTSAVAALPTTSLSLHAPVFNMQQPPPPKHLNKTSPSSSASSPPPTSSRNPSASALTLTAAKRSDLNGSSTHTPTSEATNGSHALTPIPSTANGSPGSSTSKGQIHVKLIQARGLNVRSSHARPYVVVQFEQNEFVSRDPTDESDKEVKGVATTLSRNSSSTALTALSTISSKVGRAAGSGGSSGSTSSRASSSHTPSSSAGSGKPGLSVMFGGPRISAHNPVWKHEVSFDVTSEQSVITINVYDRAVSDLGFLGTVQIKPVLVHEHTVDQWYKLKPYENEPITGEIRVQVTFEANKTRRALTPRDFEFLKLIGRGTFGKVFQVRKKDTKRIYAMKILSKREIIAKKEVAHTIGERKILQRSLESPFLVGLKFSFQTDTDLYLVTDFKSGGELFWHLQRETRFSEERARFYIAELVLALEHLHKYDIVYRDLKPENILLDATGHVALCDFGLSKPDLRSDELTNTFCGTTEYLAPEVLLDEHGYSKLVDFWSLGVLLFEMCCGWSPFYAEDTQQMYKNICFGKIRFPKGVIGEDGKQFVKGVSSISLLLSPFSRLSAPFFLNPSIASQP
ncbi:unnamed protein product [Somion occarium]|uniref:Uncharacterized protein n=1 Tax=Somion occarium TaxID=3059160 RepID=A0ABP1D192_9APHY